MAKEQGSDSGGAVSHESGLATMGEQAVAEIARSEAIAQGIALVLQGSSVLAASRAVGIPETTLRRHVASTSEYVRDRREAVAIRALDVADKLVGRMQREGDSTDAKNVAPWARASAALAGLDRPSEGGGAAGDVVTQLVNALGGGSGVVTVAAKVERDTDD